MWGDRASIATVTVNDGVLHASVPCGVAMFTCTCGASAVEYDLNRGVPDRWVAADAGFTSWPGRGGAGSFK